MFSDLIYQGSTSKTEPVGVFMYIYIYMQGSGWGERERRGEVRSWLTGLQAG